MRINKKTIFFLVLMAGLSFLPVTYVLASGSMTCNNSNPFACAGADAFSFGDKLLSVFLGSVTRFSDFFHFQDLPPTMRVGLVQLVPNDLFHFLDASVTLSITNPNSNNPYTQTTTNFQNEITLTDNLSDTLITTYISPVVLIIAVVGVSTKIGMKEFPIIIGVAMFAFSGLIWVKILPTYFIVVPIFIAAAALSILVSKFFGTRSQGEA